MPDIPHAPNATAGLSRRGFLGLAAAVTVGFTGLQRFTLAAEAGGGSEPLTTAGYGPLVPDPAGLLDLPRGFSYRIISRQGIEMSDGLLVPGAPDGMAAFPAAGRGMSDRYSVIVRNHELSPNWLDRSPFGPRHERLRELGDRVSRLYDAGNGKTPSLGGTTTVLYDHHTGRTVREFLSLGGTVRNCAGGPTPWGSWITCEETAARAGDAGMERDHGYNFEVPARADGGLVQAVPLKDMGRFMHEAVAVDPLTGVVYQTEDRHDGLIYRFLPHTRGELAAGGKLQMLALRGRGSADTRNWDEQTVGVGDVLEVDWMDVADPENSGENGDKEGGTLREIGFAGGAARFARGEGMWYGNGCVYFACTNGGRRKKGQIWRYVPSRFEGQPEERRYPGRLELFVEPNDSDLVNNADNLTVAPWGDLIVCEDNSKDQHLRGVTRDGKLYTLARNSQGSSEFAGACFSPEGVNPTTLFVNIQHVGLTLAITGPWETRA